MRPVDFKRCKELIRYGQVLGLLGWTHLRTEAGWLRGPCPVHRSSNPWSTSFAVSAAGWKCHSCGRHGDQLRLYAEAVGKPILAATVELCERLGLTVPYLPRPPRRPRDGGTEKRPV